MGVGMQMCDEILCLEDMPTLRLSNVAGSDRLAWFGRCDGRQGNHSKWLA